MRVRLRLTIGYVGATHEDIIEMPDGSTEKQIDQELQDWASNYIETWYEVLPDKDED